MWKTHGETLGTSSTNGEFSTSTNRFQEGNWFKNNLSLLIKSLKLYPIVLNFHSLLIRYLRYFPVNHRRITRVRSSSDWNLGMLAGSPNLMAENLLKWLNKNPTLMLFPWKNLDFLMDFPIFPCENARQTGLSLDVFFFPWYWFQINSLGAY